MISSREATVAEVSPTGTSRLRLRTAANAQGTLLAGAEMQIGEAGFAPILAGGLYDVVMPDVKYAGGFAEMLKIAAYAHRHGGACSPHNPTGPVCNMARMHLMCASEQYSKIEFQLGESALLVDVVGGAGPRLADGQFARPAETPGLGLKLDDAVLAANPFAPVPQGLDPRLG